MTLRRVAARRPRPTTPAPFAFVAGADEREAIAGRTERRPPPVSVSSYCGFRLQVVDPRLALERHALVKHDARAVGRPRRRANLACRSALAVRVVDAALRLRPCGCSRRRRRAAIDGLNFTPGPAGSSDVAPLAMSIDDDPRVFRVLRHRAAIVERLLRRHAVGDHAPAVGGPLRAAAEAAVRREPLQARPVGMDDVEVGEVQMFPAAVRERQVARAIRRERNPLSVGRPRRTEVSARARRQRLRASASADPSSTGRRCRRRAC